MAESLATGPADAPREDPLASESLARGTRLGRYELLVPVAVGGMARVWAARLHGQRGFTKLVAIKTILPHLASDPEFERMLIDEARIASGTRHPNVVEIYELGEERGVVYIAMEWVYGDSLSHVLKVSGTAGGMSPLDPRVAARIAADAAAGLHAAHNLVDDEGRALEVVHRDVSPHNLLITLDGNVKVTDFGVAKAIGASHEATSAGQLKGKIAYMAPEQATGAGVDRRSDVFSLGCVLYEATTGKQPFRGEGEHQVMQELIKGSFTPPSRVVRGYPYDLERIVVRAMAAQPLHRYQAMDQMRLALEEWLAKGGAVITQSNVAQVVRERIGADVEKRREKIRVATTAMAERGDPDPSQMTPSGASVRPPSAGTPSGVKATGSGPGRASYTSLGAVPAVPPGAPFPPVIELAPRTPSGPQYIVAAALGVLAAASLGAGGFWVWKSMQPVPSAPASVVVVTPVEMEPAVLPPTPPPTGTAGTAATVESVPIVFKVIPEKANLVVNGSALAVSVRSIPRPTAGVAQKVTVHADGYEDQTLTIDDSAPASVDVWLNEVAPKKTGGHGGEVIPKPSEALPANPY
jgi:serine/threonine-protein kinase